MVILVTVERCQCLFWSLQTLDVSLRKMTLQIEELLLLKLLQFFGYVQQDDDVTAANQEDDECLYAAQRFHHFCLSSYHSTSKIQI